MQDRISKGEITVQKIGGDENLADHLTKYLSKDGIAQHMSGTAQWFASGRHELMPEVAEEDFGEDEGLEYEEVGEQNEDEENCLGRLGINFGKWLVGLKLYKHLFEREGNRTSNIQQEI